MEPGHPSLSAHGDVLNATPTEPEERARLVEELKSRGNAAFKAGQLPVADTLYSKAIEHDGNNAVNHKPSPDEIAIAKLLSDLLVSAASLRQS